MNHKHTVSGPVSFHLIATVVILVVGTLLGVGITSPYALITVIVDGLRACIVLAGPVFLGLWLVPVFRLGPMPFRWHLLLGAVIGIGATSLLILILGLGGLLQRNLWIVLQILFVVAGAVRLRTLLSGGQATTDSDSADTDETPAAMRYLWMLAGPFLCLALLAAANAPGLIWQEEGFGYDVLEYHLQMPKEYFHAGRIEYAPHNVYANFPASVEMLYLLAMILFDDDLDIGVVANMIHLALAVLTVFAAWAGGRQWSALAGVVSAIAMATTGWLAYLCGLAYVENGLLFFGVTATVLLIRVAPRAAGGMESRSIGSPRELPECGRCLALAGVITGFACGCKYTALPLIALPLGVCTLCLPARSVRRRIADAAIFTIATLLIFCPWLIKNQVMTGNPVFPIANSVFKASPPGWGTTQTEAWDRGHALSPDEAAASARLSALWWRIPRDPLQRFGPLVILLPIVGLFGRKRDRIDSILLIILLLQLAVWMLATHLFARFAVVMLIPLAILCGRSVADVDAAVGRLIISAALIIGTAWNFTFAAKLHINESPRGAPASLMYDGELPGYEYFKVVNHELPRDARVLLVGDAKAFYFQRDVDYCVVFNENPFIQTIRSAKADRDIIDWLRNQGYTHVLVNWSEVRRLSRTYGFAPEVNPSLFARLLGEDLSLMHEFSHPTNGGRYIMLYRVL
ncbi:MAG: hypothetical protein ACYTFA_15630 [Planctomycetota bacterium]|jgi:hypothetical protein